MLKSLLIGVDEAEGVGIIRKFMANGGNLRRDVEINAAPSVRGSLADEVASLLDDSLDATAQLI